MTDNTEPTIVTSTSAQSFEPITLEPYNPQPTPNATAAQSATATVGSATANAMLEAVKLSVSSWKDERFKSLRPMAEFFDRSKLSIPGFSEIVTRVKDNLIWYQTNYLVVFLVLAIYSVLTSPMFLIALVLVGGAWMWSFKFREGPLQIRGREVPEKLLTFFLLLFSLVIFYLCSATNVLLWLLAAAVLFIFLHALLMKSQPVDEFGFGISAADQAAQQPQPAYTLPEAKVSPV